MTVSQIDRTPAEQMTKALESLRVIKLALASRNSLDAEDLSCLEYTLLEAMEELRPIRDLLEEEAVSRGKSPSETSQTSVVRIGKHQIAA